MTPTWAYLGNEAQQLGNAHSKGRGLEVCKGSHAAISGLHKHIGGRAEEGKGGLLGAGQAALRNEIKRTQINISVMMMMIMTMIMIFRRKLVIVRTIGWGEGAHLHDGIHGQSDAHMELTIQIGIAANHKLLQEQHTIRIAEGEWNL